MKTTILTTLLAFFSLVALNAQNISSQPADTSVCAGSAASFSISAASVSAYQWQAYSLGSWNNIGDTGTYYGTSTATLSLSNTTGLDSVLYRCIVTDNSSLNETSMAAMLSMLNPAVITTQPASVSVCPQSAVSFSTTATGSGLSYQWQEDNGSGFADIVASGVYSGVSGAILSIDTSGVNVAHTGAQFRCIVHGICGNPDTSVAAQLSVHTPPIASITIAGSNSICNGDSVLLSASTASGNSYQWEINSIAQTGAGISLYAHVTGTYDLIVTDSSTGCNALASTTVLINSLPTVSASITGVNGRCAGDSVALTATLDPALSYQWTLNGSDISGATGFQYYAVASGDYEVRVTDPNGCSSIGIAGTVVIHALPAATITYNTPLSFCAGSAVVLTANSGSDIAGYQWLVNGVPDTLNTSNYMAANASGMYAVEVTSIYNCSSTSTPLSVTINPLPAPVITQAGNMLSAGTGYASYQWYLNGAAINGATSSTYSPAQNGIYTVTVTSAAGCQGTSATFSITALSASSLSSTANAVKVYPNPTNGILHVSYSGAANVRIQNIEGRVLLQQTASTSIDLQAFSNGLYVLTVLSPAGERIMAERIIVSK